MKKAILLTIGVWVGACSSKGSAPPGGEGAAAPGKGGAEEVPAAQPADGKPEAEEAVLKGPGKLLPKTISGWSLSGVPRYFGPENLYDLIDGGAEIYVEMGFKEMVTADYQSSRHAGVTVTLEIYDMGSPLGAFGRTARFLNGQQDPSGAGEGLPDPLKARGMLGETDLIFWKGQHLVHLTAMDESPKATRESMAALGKGLLPGFAEATANAIPGEAPFPREVAAFPEAHRIARTEAWEPKTLAGIADLGPGFSARYQSGQAMWSLFVTEEIGDPKAIEARMSRLKENARDKEAKAVTTGKRLAGYVAEGDSLTPKDKALLETQVKALAAAFGGQ